jgi:plasmid maintenance system antidote protein VapI
MRLKQNGTIGERLATIIKMKNFRSQAALARAIGISQGAINSAITKDRVTKQMALAIQGALGISAEWILHGLEPIEAQVELMRNVPIMNNSQYVREPTRSELETLHQQYIFASYELYNDPRNEKKLQRLELVKRRMRTVSPVIII